MFIVEKCAIMSAGVKIASKSSETNLLILINVLFSFLQLPTSGELALQLSNNKNDTSVILSSFMGHFNVSSGPTLNGNHVNLNSLQVLEDSNNNVKKNKKEKSQNRKLSATPSQNLPNQSIQEHPEELRRTVKSSDKRRFGGSWSARETGNILDINWDPAPPKLVDSQKDLVQPDETHLEGVPSFIQHPKPLYYTMKGHPATIECVAEPVSHAVIECAEQVIPYKGPDDAAGRLKVTQLDSLNRPDPNGKRWHLQLQVRAKEVEEWFDSYVCRCEAWNKVVELQRPKKVVSRETVVIEAYLERKFQIEPVSTDLTVGKRLVLTCMPPKGKPDPEVYWLKDGKRVNSKTFPHIIINDYNHLIIENATVVDSGNYTCVAECLGVEYRYANAKVNIFPYPPTSSSLSHHPAVVAPVATGWTEWNPCTWTSSAPASVSPVVESRLCQQSRYRLCATKVSLEKTPSTGTNNELASRVDQFDSVVPLDCPVPWVQSRNCSPTDCQNAGQAFGYAVEDDTHQGQNGSFRAKEIAVYVGLFLSLALLLGIAAVVIARWRKLKLTSVHIMPFPCCFQGKKHQDKSANMPRASALLLTNDYKQSTITFKNPSTVDSCQLDETMCQTRLSSLPNGSQLIMNQYNNHNPLHGNQSQHPFMSLYTSNGPAVQLTNQNLHFSNGLSSPTVKPLLPPPPPPPSSLPPIPTNPLLSGPTSGASELSGYTGSVPSTQYFLAGLAPTQIMSQGCLLTNLQTQNTAEYMITPTTYSQINAFPTDAPNSREVEDALSRLAQAQQQSLLFNGTTLPPISAGSSSGQSPANTATTAVGSGNGGSSNGSLGLAITTGQLSTGATGTYGPMDQSEAEIVTPYDTHSRPTSALYHELSLDQTSMGGPTTEREGTVTDTFESVVRGSMSSNGGILCLSGSGVYLNIPHGAIRPNTMEEVYLAVCREDRQRPTMNDHQTLLSPVAKFGPSDLKLLRPATLSFPHCAALNQGNWIIRLLAMKTSRDHDRNGIDGFMPSLTTSYNGEGSLRRIPGTDRGQSEHLVWKELCVIGNEPLNMNVFCHLDSSTVHLITDSPGQYCLVGESLKISEPANMMPKSLSQKDFAALNSGLSHPGKVIRTVNDGMKDNGIQLNLTNIQPATKMLRLAAFAGRLTPTMDYNIRVYVLADTKDALEHVTSMESRLDGHLLDSTKPFPFKDNGIGLSFRIEDVSIGWRSRLQTRVQEIPFRHIWSGTQMAMLHCAFSLEHVDPAYPTVSCHIVVYQESAHGQYQILDIASSNAECASSLFRQPTIQSVRSVPYVDDSLSSSTAIKPFRLLWSVKRRICDLMEHCGPQENDWRALAVQLGMDRHIMHLASKKNPTSSLLDLWEAQHRNGLGLDELKYKFINIGRMDCANLIDFEMTQMWDKK